MFLYSCENLIAHPFEVSVGVVGNVPSKKMEKSEFWSVLLYILILFCLKNVHCLYL